MPTENLILPSLLLIPLVSAGIVALVPREKGRTAATLAFVLSLIPLAIAAWLVWAFNYSAAGSWQFTLSWNWLEDFNVKFTLGLDSISLWLVLLTAVLTPLAILGSFQYIKSRQNEFYAWMLLLHTSMLGVFCARDLLVFYLFFEFTLIPMFFIIGSWGGQERRHASVKFFLYTFAGSVLTLVSLLYISYRYSLVYGTPSFRMADLYAFGPTLPPATQYVLFLGLMAGFAVKVPLFPFHTWLPLAHTEAPTPGSVILAGVLLKLGTYGILRWALPVLPAATLHFAPAIAVICIVGIIYGALVSWVQGDMKRLIAYSSVSHLGFCVLGMFALTTEGLSGSVMYMINHGISTGALFLVVGMIYERFHTRDMNELSGLVRKLPALAFFAVFFVLSSIALPGTNGFISEFLVLVGTYVSGQGAHGGPLGPWYAVFAATGVILGAVYLLYWAGRVIYGPLKMPAHDHGEDEAAGHEAPRDLSLREWCVLTPLAAAVLIIGIYPVPMLNSLRPAVEGVQAAVLHPEASRLGAAPSDAPAVAEAR
jgi:NADH-quinone oxidoreductase subunit M